MILTKHVHTTMCNMEHSHLIHIFIVLLIQVSLLLRFLWCGYNFLVIQSSFRWDLFDYFILLTVIVLDEYTATLLRLSIEFVQLFWKDAHLLLYTLLMARYRNEWVQMLIFCATWLVHLTNFVTFLMEWEGPLYPN